MMHPNRTMQKQSQTLPGSSTPAKAWQASHDVQFYDDEAYLASSVARFLAAGIKSAQPAVVIATPAHTAAIQDELRAMGIDVDALRAFDMVWLDANDTLSAFMEGGKPNRELFYATVGNVFERVTNARRYVTVRAYGEMVNLLWRDGKAQQAIELEQLWNELASMYAFALLCAYATDSLDPSDLTGIERICAVHSAVLPSRPIA
jgi:hypothetical protein